MEETALDIAHNLVGELQKSTREKFIKVSIQEL